MQDALTPPQLAVITAVPGPTAVTRPPLLTEATAPLEVDQRTVRSDALEGDTVAVRLRLPPTSRIALLWERERPVTDTTCTCGVGWGVLTDGAGVGCGVVLTSV